MATAVSTGPAFGKDVVIHIDGVNISGRAREIGLSIDGQVVDKTGMGASSWRSFLGGLKGWTATVAAILHYGTGEPDDTGALDQVGSDVGVVSFMPLGDAWGRAALYAASAELNTLARDSTLEDLVTITVGMQGDGPLYPGQVIMPKSAIVTFPLTGSTLDQAASSSDGSVSYLHVFTVSASDTVTVIVRDSNDDSIFVDHATFASVAAAAAPTSEAVTVAGTVERYIRIEGTISGAGANEATIAVGFARL